MGVRHVRASPTTYDTALILKNRLTRPSCTETRKDVVVHSRNRAWTDQSSSSRPRSLPVQWDTRRQSELLIRVCARQDRSISTCMSNPSLESSYGQRSMLTTNSKDLDPRPIRRQRSPSRILARPSRSPESRQDQISRRLQLRHPPSRRVGGVYQGRRRRRDLRWPVRAASLAGPF